MSRSASVCWQVECWCRLITETRGRESWVLWRFLCLSFVSSVNKLIFLTFLYPIYTSNTESWWVSKKSFHIFNQCKNVELTKLWAQFGFFSAKDKWLCFECRDVSISKSNDARQSHYLQRLQSIIVARWWLVAAAHPENWKVATRRVCVSSAHLLTNHGTAAAPGPGSRAHRPHPLYNRRPGSGAPVQCRCSYWQHRSGHQHHLGGDKYFLMVQIFSECGVLGWPQQLDTPLQYHAHQ